MKIGDRVFIHGYIDEIRKDTVIIRNNGGYFGTIPSEVITGDLSSAQSEPKWIPVTERLPEKYGWYLCTLKDTRVNSYYWNNKGEWVDNGKKHFFELYNISSRYTGENITAEQEGSVYWTDWVIAWMPLPEPWKEGEQGRSDQDREDIISICDDARLGYNVGTYHNCNNCGRKECQFKPEWGETIWWKCPLWEEGENE